MKNLIFTITALITLTNSYSQKEIVNVKSEKHLQIAGSKYFLIPPTGFTVANTFQGFQQSNSGASILLTEIPGSFFEITKGFTAEALKTKGVILKEKEDLKINGYQGSLYTTEQFAQGINFKKYIFVFGDSKFTAMVNGTFPLELTDLNKEILESLFSIVYEPNLIVDPLSSSTFSIKTENTKLKFAKSLSGSLLYTVDGKVPTESKDKTTFIVSLSFANIQTIDKKLTSIDRFKQLPYTDIKIDEDQIFPVEIDGISGYDIVGYGLNDLGEKELIYQVMLYTDNGYYLLLGSTPHDFQENLNLFKNVAKTLRRK